MLGWFFLSSVMCLLSQPWKQNWYLKSTFGKNGSRYETKWSVAEIKKAVLFSPHSEIVFWMKKALNVLALIHTEWNRSLL